MAGELGKSLPESWEVRRLDEVATIIDSLHKTPSYSDDGSPMVRVTDVQGGFLDLSKTLRVSVEVFQEFTRRYAPKKGDMVFSRVGSYGNVSYARTEIPFCLGQNTALISPRINGRFLHQFLQSAGARWQIEQVVVGSTQKTISLKSIGALQIPIPPPGELEAIAAVLGTLDDKIELNRRMNATLEAMARALFQSWFVDFDPVRAKLEGRKPVGVDSATAVLFPGTFQASPIGAIPAGWEAVELGQIANVIDCLHAKKPERCEVGQLYLQLNNIRDDGLIDITDSFLVSAEDYQKWISRMEAVAGDCVITNVGRVGAVGQIPEGVKAALGRNITGIRCKADFPFPTFLIECLVSESMREEIRFKTDSGTILDALNVKSIPKLRLARPSREVAARFEQLTRPLRWQMERNISTSRSLAILRDTLLPKLLSGELSVANAHKVGHNPERQSA